MKLITACALVLGLILPVAAAEKNSEKPANKPARIAPNAAEPKAADPKAATPKIAAAQANASATDPSAMSPAARAVAARGEDFKRIPVVLGLTGPALEKYNQSLVKRAEGYEKWLKSARGQEYTAAEKAIGGARRAPKAAEPGATLTEAQKKFQTLRAEQEAVRKELRREFNKQFDLDQLRLWAGNMLYQGVIDQFKAANLGDDQKQQAFVVCAVLAAALTGEGEIQRDPYLEPTENLKEAATAMIKLTVLKPDQQKAAATAATSEKK